MPGLRGITAPVVPDEFGDVLHAGIGIFQLVHPKKLYRDEKIWGPFSAKAINLDPDNYDMSKRKYRIDWQTGKEAYIRFFENNKRGTAYVPDDVFWHNRMFFLHQPAYLGWMEQYVSPDGTLKQRPEMAMEIGCIGEEIMEERKIWMVMINGEEKDYFFAKKLADEYISESKDVNLAITEQGVKTVRKDKRKFTIETGVKSDVKDEVKELIRREKYLHRFGWTECETFMKEIKPKIVARIKEKQDAFKADPAGSGISVDMLIDTIKKMSPEERALLREASEPKTEKKKAKEIVT